MLSARAVRIAVIVTSLAAAVLTAQAQDTRAATEHPDSRFDVYAGYGYWHPINSGIGGKQYGDISGTLNGTASVSYFFNHYVGVQVEGSYFSTTNDQHNKYVPNCKGTQCDQIVYTAEAGPVLRWPLGPFVPFIHALGGGEKLNGPAAQPLKWGWGVTGGGGVDYVLPFFSKHLAVRIVQADWQYAQVVYGPLVLPAGIQGGFGEVSALRLTGGIVGRFSTREDKEAVSFGCGAEPMTVHPGEPVTITGSTLGLNPKKKTTYVWRSNGGVVMPSGPSASVDTKGLTPGQYTVNGHVEQGAKANQQASCNAPFTVVAFEPPSLTCSARPATVTSGTDVQIVTVGASPQNRPLTYSFSADSGVIVGNGSTARLSTAGLSAKTVTVQCGAVDDLGQEAHATTQVTVTNPPVPVQVQTQPLCSITFLHDQRRPVRVDNEAKACLDDVALTLARQSDSKIVITGNTSAEEKPEDAAERALNARQYLSQEKGIDASRIETRVGVTSGRTADITLVPAGAVYNDANTQAFDPGTIVRHGEAYGTGAARTTTPVSRRPHHRKKKPAAAATEPAPSAGSTTP